MMVSVVVLSCWLVPRIDWMNVLRSELFAWLGLNTSAYDIPKNTANVLPDNITKLKNVLGISLLLCHSRRSPHSSQNLAVLLSTRFPHVLQYLTLDGDAG
jgi:hypothetical protein